MIETFEIKGKTFKAEAGSHSPDGTACVMEAVSWLADEPWSDAPSCASPVIGAFCRSFWDASPANWPGLIERIPRIAGSANPAADDARAWLATDWLVRTFTPVWLRKAGLDPEADSLAALPALTSTALARDAQPIIEAARAKARAVRAAAGDAAWDAAWVAVRVAVRVAARAAARDAVRAAASKHKTWETQYTAAYKASRAILDGALSETVTEMRASAFDLLDRMLFQGAPS